MKRIHSTYIIFLLSLILSGTGCMEAFAQTANSQLADSLGRQNEMELKELETPINSATLSTHMDATQKEMPQPRERFIPNSNRSVWLAMVFPGAGQIYNRKYWKLPIVYGGFVGCAYALNWNSKMYKDYSQAYLDIMDDDPNTKSFEDFLPLNFNISGQEERYKEIFRKRKDLYRRQRDLSIFSFIGVYLLSIIDAYVDAELSDFDITKDNSLKIEPTTFNQESTRNINSIGLQSNFSF